MPTDAYWAVACLALIVTLAFAVTVIDAQHKALKRGQALIDHLRAKLGQASANDARDPRSGRYVGRI